MRNKIIAIVVIFLIVLGAAGWFFWVQNDKPEKPPIIDAVFVQQGVVEMPEEEISHSSDMGSLRMEFDGSSEETRIILENSDDGDLRGLLSEKVIRDGKIVDKSHDD